MPREQDGFHGSVDRAAIDAGIRNAHKIRSQFFACLTVRAAKDIASWFRAKGR
jgi:hypothetical protein